MTLVKKLTLSDVTDMIAHFIWVPALYKSYCKSIKEENFNRTPLVPETDETCLMCVWGALKGYYDAHGTSEVPDKSRLEVYIRDYMRGIDLNPDGVEDYEYTLEDNLFGDDPTASFLPNLYDEERRTLNMATGNKLVHTFLNERCIYGASRQHFENIKNMLEGWVDTNEAANLRKMADEASRIEAMTSDIDIQPLVPELSYFKVTEGKRAIPTGIAWVDERLNKGQRYGEVNGLFGPTGSGKTTFACQLFVSNVREAYKDSQLEIEDKFCVYYTYEQSASEVTRTRILSSAFELARDSLNDEMNYEATFSRGEEDRKLYEKNKKFSEYERYYNERDKFNRHGIIRNMSGVPDVGDTEELIQRKKHKGEGGIEELVHDLDFLTGYCHMGVRAVFIDYLGLVIDRQYRDRDEKERWNAMRSFGDEVRQKIAGAFDCTVWLLHQMSGTANAKNPTNPLKHTDAAGCKSLADNMANCLCLGTKDKSTDCLYLTFSKTRHAGGQGHSDADLIIQHNKTYARLDNVTQRYLPDKANQSFYLKNRSEREEYFNDN